MQGININDFFIKDLSLSTNKTIIDMTDDYSTNHGLFEFKPEEITTSRKIKILELSIIMEDTTDFVCSRFGGTNQALPNGIEFKFNNNLIYNIKSNQDLSNIATYTNSIIIESGINTAEHGIIQTQNQVYKIDFKKLCNGLILLPGQGEKICFYLRDDLSAIFNLQALVKGYMFD